MKIPPCADCPKISGNFTCLTTEAYATPVTISGACARQTEQALTDFDLTLQIATSPADIYRSMEDIRASGLSIRLG